jgi:hypothetical protein
MSSIGRYDGIVEGEVEPYVTAFAAVLAASRFAAEALFALCGSDVELVAVDVCGRVNSSKRSASRGWCMCRYEAEESLLWWFGVSLGFGGLSGKF